MPELAMKPIPEGGTEGHVPNMEKMLPEYYALRAWDSTTGKPSKKRLNDLGMSEIAAAINAK
jgi:aldehyde:ferredoxin oxidoreductase